MFSKQALRRLILPLIIEQFLAVMVGMADIMMVSSAGEAAVSSVALVDLINVLIINIFAALATGGAVVCAQSIGAQNLERANRAANQLLYIVTAAALGIMVLVLFCKAGLLGLLFGQVEPEVMEGAVTYFVISALSYPFIAVYNGCAALLRAMGNSKASMCVSAYMNGQNIAGNAVFVFVFHQGVAGVALSSLLSRIAAAGLMLALLHGRRNPVRVSGLLRFRFEPAVMAQILRIGVPNGLENSFFQLGRVLLVSLISTFGTAQTAANAVANNIDNFGVIPGQALGLALITVVGQCVGAGDWDQVRAYTKRLVKLTYLCTWGLNAALLLGLPLILRLYSLTPETQWYAAVLIFIHNGCAMLFWPLAFTMPNALRAAGDVRVPMVISITSMLVVRVGAAICWASTSAWAPSACGWPWWGTGSFGSSASCSAPEKSCGWSTAEYAHPKPFGCAFSLPEAQRVLHAQAHCRDGRPAAQAHQNGSAAGPDEFDQIGIEPNGRHGHDDEELGQLLKRSKSRCVHSCQGRPRSNQGSQHEEQEEEGEHPPEREASLPRAACPPGPGGAPESQRKGDGDDGQSAGELDNGGGIQGVGPGVHSVPGRGSGRDGRGIIHRRAGKESEALVSQTQQAAQGGEQEGGRHIEQEDDRDGLGDLLVVRADDRGGGRDGGAAADG